MSDHMPTPCEIHGHDFPCSMLGAITGSCLRCGAPPDARYNVNFFSVQETCHCGEKTAKNWAWWSGGVLCFYCYLQIKTQQRFARAPGA
jgi:hypothetical protein